jgi:hypothetical protein
MAPPCTSCSFGELRHSAQLLAARPPAALRVLTLRWLINVIGGEEAPPAAGVPLSSGGRGDRGLEVEDGDDMWAKSVSESSNLMFYFKINMI